MKKRFTKIDLIVTMSAVAVLTAVALPTLTDQKEKAQNSQCLSNLRQLGIFYTQKATNDQMVLPSLAWIDSTENGDRVYTQELKEVHGTLQSAYLTSSAAALMACPQ